MAISEQDIVSGYNLALAKVLLFDGQEIARRNTREALSCAGLTRIREVSSVRDLTRNLTEKSHDLIVVASVHVDDGMADLLRRLRRHKVGADPFAPVVATISSKDDRLVQKVAFSGVDHIICKPFSSDQMVRRLEAIVGRRQGFIETLDYLGPDRRKDQARDERDEAIVVPNALKARVQRMADWAPNEKNIAAAKSALTRLRTRNIGRRIAAAVKDMGRAATEGGTDGNWEAQFAILSRCLKGLHELAQSAEGARVGKACISLHRAAVRFRDADGCSRRHANEAMIAEAKGLLEALQTVKPTAG